MIILGNLQEVADIFLDGGTVMAALAIVAFLLYTTATASLYFVLRGNLNNGQRSEWADWINEPEDAQGRIG